MFCHSRRRREEIMTLKKRAGAEPASGAETGRLRKRAATAALAAMLGSPIMAASPALALDKVTFGTNWLADPEAGGFYQAVVDGTYAKYGLDVTIMPGGPQANNRLLLPTGKIDFYMGGNMLQAY